MPELSLKRELSKTLQNIKRNDTNYDKRYKLVIKALALAEACGYKVGFRVDGWPVAVIHLPTWQVSWHMPPDPIKYDNHTTEEKYTRIDEFTKKKKIKI